MTPEFKRLLPGLSKVAGTDYIEKDTIFANSPSISEYGGYKFGIELNVAGMSHPAVAEDGILISEDVLPRLRFKVYEKRVVEFGTSTFPLNLYGHANRYQPFPEIGQLIREDGILAMLRRYDQDLGPVLTSITDCMSPDFIFDDAIYVRGPGTVMQGEKNGQPIEIKSGKIVDIKIYHDEAENSPTPEGVMSGMNKYTRALKRFYRELLDAYEHIRSERRKKYGEAEIVLKPELHRLLVEAMAVLGKPCGKTNSRLNLVYRKVPLDDYRVEFTIEYTVQPTIGYKLTCCQGGKGVICYIEKPENMPVDAAGNRADIVVGAETTFQSYELRPTV
jgi:DNA-directed RNA polymerase beta subunit